MSALGTKSPPGRSWLPGRGGAVLAVRPANRLVRVDGQVRVRTVGRDQGARGVAAGAVPMSLPPTRLSSASPDRLVAALVIMIQQASRDHHVDAGTLAASKRLRTA